MYDTVTSDVDPATMGNDSTSYTQGDGRQTIGQTSIAGGYGGSTYDNTNTNAGIGSNGLQSRYADSPTASRSTWQSLCDIPRNDANVLPRKLASEYDTNTSGYNANNNPAMTTGRDTDMARNENAGDVDDGIHSTETETGALANPPSENAALGGPGAAGGVLPSRETMDRSEKEFEQERGGPPPKPPVI